ncbi:hypothetical protein [Pseudomonas aeruginosa]|uniref:hypothetical protein n=1 Tax=Pseudomonas aeruginosa TaxID=287 RepID=UPI0013A5734E|nr:hypothetical protein [Pseudomonas aeruginosa]
MLSCRLPLDHLSWCLHASFIADGKGMAMFQEEVTIKLRPSHLLGCVLVSPFMVLLGCWIWSWGWSSANAPAWVQAVGSVVAIFVSWIFFVLDKRIQRRKQTEDNKLMLKQTVGVAKHAGKLGKMVISSVKEKRGGQQQALFGTSEYLSTMRSVNFNQLPTVDSALAWLELQHALSDLCQIVQVDEPESVEFHRLAPLAVVIDRAIARLVIDAAAFIPELGDEASMLKALGTSRKKIDGPPLPKSLD